MSILSSTYQLYACGKISMRALILNENLNFSRSPKIIMGNRCFARSGRAAIALMVHDGEAVFVLFGASRNELSLTAITGGTIS
jgi:hypothetical protein